MPRLILLLVLSGLMATLAIIFYLSPTYPNLEAHFATRTTTASLEAPSGEEVSTPKSRAALHAASRKRRELEEKRRSIRRQRIVQTAENDKPVVTLKLIPVSELQDRIKTIRSSADFVRLFTEQDLSDQEIYTWMSSYKQQATHQTDPRSDNKPFSRVVRAVRGDLSKEKLDNFTAALNHSESSLHKKAVKKTSTILRTDQLTSTEDTFPNDSKRLQATESPKDGRNKDTKMKELDNKPTNISESDAEKEFLKAYDQLKDFINGASVNDVSNVTNKAHISNIAKNDNYGQHDYTGAKNISELEEELRGSTASTWNPLGPLRNTSSIHDLLLSRPILAKDTSSSERTGPFVDEDLEVPDNFPYASVDKLNITVSYLNSTSSLNNSKTLPLNVSEELQAEKVESNSSESSSTFSSKESVDRKTFSEHGLSNVTLRVPIAINNTSATSSAVPPTIVTTAIREHPENTRKSTNRDTVMTKARGKTPDEYNWARLVKGLHLEIEEALLAAAYRLDNIIYNRDEYVCHKPSKYLQSVSHPYLTDIMLIPDCVMLHRCLPHSGCCQGPSTCGPKTIEVVHIPFLVLTIYDQRARLQPDKALFLSFVNHTECTCVVDEEYRKSATTCEKQCPQPFQLARVGHSCICDCLNSRSTDGANLQYCEEIKHGARPLLANAVSCIKGGNCNEPKCEIGTFNISTGYCPLSDEYALPSCFLKHKHGGNVRQYREHLRLPSLPSTRTTNRKATKNTSSKTATAAKITTTTKALAAKIITAPTSAIPESNYTNITKPESQNFTTGANSTIDTRSALSKQAPNNKNSSLHNESNTSKKLSTDNISSTEAHSDTLPVTNTQLTNTSVSSETEPEEDLEFSVSTPAFPALTDTDMDLDYQSEEHEEGNDSLTYIGEKVMEEIYRRFYDSEKHNETEFLDDDD